MHWFQLPTDVQRIVWDYAGSLERAATRRRRFLGLEIKCWALVMGQTPVPSLIKRYYGFVGRDKLHQSLYEAWDECRLPKVH
jgi:hypothetical protein